MILLFMSCIASGESSSETHGAAVVVALMLRAGECCEGYYCDCGGCVW